MSDWADDTEQRALVGGATDWDDDAAVPYATPTQAGGGATDFDDDDAVPDTAPATPLPIGTFDFPDDEVTPTRLSATVAADWEDDTPQPTLAAVTTPAAVGVNDAGNFGYGMAKNTPLGPSSVFVQMRVGFTGYPPGPALLFGGFLYGNTVNIPAPPVGGGANGRQLLQEFLDWAAVGSTPQIGWGKDDIAGTWSDNGSITPATWFLVEHSASATGVIQTVGLEDFQRVDEHLFIDGTDFGVRQRWADLGLTPQAPQVFGSVELDVLALDPAQTAYIAWIKIGTTGFGATDIISFDASTDTIAAKFDVVDAGTPGWSDGSAPF